MRMGERAAVKLNRGRASLILYNFYVAHSDAFAHEPGAKSLADCFFCSPPCREALSLLIKVLGGIAVSNLIFRKALIEKGRIAFFLFRLSLLQNW